MAPRKTTRRATRNGAGNSTSTSISTANAAGAPSKSLESPVSPLPRSFSPENPSISMVLNGNGDGNEVKTEPEVSVQMPQGENADVQMTNEDANANVIATAANTDTDTNTVAAAVVEPSTMDTATENTVAAAAAAVDTEEDQCPACTPQTRELLSRSRKESWIACDHCKLWYHWRCAGNGEDVGNIAKWYCKTCTDTDPTGTRIMTLKAPARKSSRKRTARDYASLNDGMPSSATDPGRFLRLMESKSALGKIKGDPFRRVTGAEIEAWLEGEEDEEEAVPGADEMLREPIVIESPEGLGMNMPPKDLTVEHVAEYIGEDVPLEVMDVATQSNSPGWNLGKWADYFEQEPSKRAKILNVISLEISGTELANMVLPPRIVRELDWVENFWPSTRKGKGHAYPKVQLYCLMGVAGAWTDWHIDFAGSSVYYHILNGAKVFYFIRPTAANLAAYEKWSGSELQYQTWLGNMVDEVYKVELKEGNTMIIPTGWIHAVYTPMDTMVFGGNFLHSYNVATQLRVREIEMNTGVPKKFTFPMFTKLCWYVGDKYLRDMKGATGKVTYSRRVLDGILALAEFLVTEARTLEKGGEQGKKEAKESIPMDRVKDGPAVARELRWRTKQLLGYDSDEDETPRRGEKRRLETQFRHFKPKVWDAMVVEKEEARTETVKVRRPRAGEDLGESWVDGEPEDEGERGQVVTVVDKVVKVRRTERGIERHLISRQVEDWSW